MENKNLREADFKDLGPIDSKNPNIHIMVYRPDNYLGPIAIDAKLKTLAESQSVS